ncbi:hypothetical protein Poli38472_008681 [Pythium oligandrum]|uniref:FAD synthase n=1 Tax=Pythium oligandrum TaxID=41045 RepID=A0A8K1C473_PYTOL|nr:hypothetical protein Poli38472_008681 [Pythium oligandrum]|eukprot:TMW56033.1 hypothetical protein Poli38472_008681 [Pythium oligandrum]
MAPTTGIRETLRKFDAFFDAVDVDTKVRLQKALDVIHRAIDIFGLEGVCFSFNGGKDSTVVLHLLRIVVAKRVLEEVKAAQDATKVTKVTTTTVTSPRHHVLDVDLVSAEELEARVAQALGRLPVMYFDSHDQFPQVRDFIEHCNTTFALQCHVYKCSFVEGVKDMLDRLHIKGVYMGVRGGDPHTEDLEHYSPSTPGWPPFLRVNPILRWTYQDVWDFLRECGLEYCSLYDHGYTSLGNIYDTVQNPALWVSGENGAEGYYLPAHALKDGNSERCGRQKRARTTSK